MNLLLSTLIACSLVSLSAHGQVRSGSAFRSQMLLSELPDGAVLTVNEDLQMGTTSYDDYDIHHVGFMKGETDTDTDLNSLSFSAYTRLLIRTMVTTALEKRTVSGWFSNSSAYFLRKGRYCLNRQMSQLPLRNKLGVEIAQDRLYFEFCDSGQYAFVLYANAGYGMVYRQGQEHFSIGRFDYHVKNVESEAPRSYLSLGSR
jgi:hypothetical protein